MNQYRNNQRPTDGNRGDRQSGPTARDLNEEAADRIDDQGRAAMANGDYQQALEYFQKAYDRSEQERHAKYYRDDIAWARGAIADRNGLAAVDRKDYAAALAFFQEACGYLPEAKRYQAQVAWAKGLILDERADRANADGDYRTALKLYLEALDLFPNPPPEYRNFVEEYRKNAAHQDKIAKTLSRIAETASDSSPAPSTPGLGFEGGAAANSPAQGPPGLDFLPLAPQEGGAGKPSTFGTTSNPAHPDLGSSPPGPAEVHSALEQLSSVSKSGSDAKQARNPEGAKGLAACGYAGVPCREPDAIKIVRIPGQTPAAMELWAHIPDGVKDDTYIRDSLAWYDSMEKSQAEKARVIGELQDRIASGKDDIVVLKARKASVENESRKLQLDQGNLKGQIKKRIIDLQMVWIEAPQQSEAVPGSAPRQPAK